MKRLKVVLGIIVIAFLFWLMSRFLLQSKPTKLTHKAIFLNSSVVVEIADTPEKTAQGLSDRESLCSNCGMLFIFPQTASYTFWMRRMHFDIDMIWILDDRVVDITHEAKKPSVEEFESPKTFYQSKTPVNKVLEVNAGWTREHNVSLGEKVVFE